MALRPQNSPSPVVGNQRHDVALALDRPELERQCGAQCVAGRDHARAREFGAVCQGVAVETDQICDEQEESSDPRGKFPRSKGKAADIGDRFGRWAEAGGPFLVEAPRQRSEAFLGENLAHRGDAERHALLLEGLTDLIDRIVALAQRHDLLMGAGLLRLRLRTGARHGEEFGQLIAAKGMAEHAEGAWGVAEAAGGLGRGQLVEEIGA